MDKIKGLLSHPVAAVVLGGLALGLILNYGKNLPVIKQARSGYTV